MSDIPTTLVVDADFNRVITNARETERELKRIFQGIESAASRQFSSGTTSAGAVAYDVERARLGLRGQVVAAGQSAVGTRGFTPEKFAQQVQAFDRLFEQRFGSLFAQLRAAPGGNRSVNSGIDRAQRESEKEAARARAQADAEAARARTRANRDEERERRRAANDTAKIERQAAQATAKELDRLQGEIATVTAQLAKFGIHADGGDGRPPGTPPRAPGAAGGDDELGRAAAHLAELQSKLAEQMRMGNIPSDFVARRLGPIASTSRSDLNELARYLATQVRNQQDGRASVFDRVGLQAGIERERGLRFGIAEEEAFRGRDRRLNPGLGLFDGATLSRQIIESLGINTESDLGMRTYLTALRRARESYEEIADLQERNQNTAFQQQKAMENAERRLRDALQSRADRETARATVSPGGERLEDLESRERVLREQTEARQRLADIQNRRALGTSGDLVNAAVAQKEETQATRLAVTRRLASSREYISAQAETIAAEHRLRAAINQQAQGLLLADPGVGGGGTRFQRLQATIAQRTGGAPRLPTEFQSFGQFFQSRFLTTAGFAASGAVMYGLQTQIRELIQEASGFSVEMGIIRGTLLSTGAAGEEAFGRVREGILLTARDTRTIASTVADVQRQLAGAFADDNLRPDFRRANIESAPGLKLAGVAKLPVQEINDSLTAVTLAFGLPEGAFERLGDLMIGLENRFGVLSPEIIRFTADLAPLAAGLGFTAEELSTLGAAAQQVSGKSGAVIAEQLGRILPSLQDRAGEIISIFSSLGDDVAAEFARAFGGNDIAQVFRLFLSNYEQLSGGLQNQLVSLVGGRREAGTFVALLDRGPQVLQALDTGAEQYAGSLEERFEQVGQTIPAALERLERAIEEFGVAVFDAGLDDGLRTLIDVGADFAEVASVILSVLGNLNHLLGGLPGRILVMAAALAALSKAGGAARGFLGSAGLGIGPSTGERAALINFMGSATGQAPFVPASGVRGRFGPTPIRSFFGSPQGRQLGLSAGLYGAGMLAGNLGTLGGVDYGSLTQNLATGAAAGNMIAGPLGAAVGTAAAAFSQLISTYKQVAAEAASQDEQLKTTILDKLRSGVSVEAILESIPQRGGAIDRLGNLVTRGTGVTSSEYAEGLVRDALVERYRPLIDALLDSNAPDSAIANLRSIIENGSAESVQTILDELTRVLAAGEITQTSGGFVIDPDRFVTSDGRRLDAIFSEFADTEKYQSLIDGAGQLRANFEQAMQKWEAGVGTQADVLAVLADNLAQTQTMIEAAIDAGQDPTELQLQRLEQLAQQQQVIDRGINSRFDRLARLQTALGGQGGSPEATLELARDRLDALQDEGGSAAAIEDAAMAVIEAQRALLDRKVDEAKTLAEKMAIAQRGVAVDATARVALVRSLVEQELQGIDTNVISDLVPSAGESPFQAILTEIQRSFEETGRIESAILTSARDALEQRIRVVRQGMELLMTVYRQLGFLDPTAFIKLHIALGTMVNQLATLNNAISLSSQVPSSLKGTVQGDTTGIAAQQRAAADDLARRIAEAQLAVRRAQADGDPVELARLAQEAANIQYRFAKDEAERLQATAAFIEASHQRRAALDDIRRAQLELAGARTNDPVADAQIQLQLAQFAVNTARGEAARLRALAQQVEAETAYRDAIRDVFASRTELAIAVAQAAGDDVAVASGQIELARQALDRARREGAGEGEINRAQAELISAQAGLRDAQLAKQRGDIEFALEMGRVTVGQAITQLQALLQIPALTEEQTREILLRIKALKDELGRDLQFDLPGDLRLPTTYEARRLLQSSQAGLNYQAAQVQNNDNRVISIELNANDPQALTQAVSTIVAAVNAPPTSGNYQSLVETV